MAFWEYNETELWRLGSNNILDIRSLGIVSFGRNVLAFCEMCEGDNAEKIFGRSICMKRSDNGGKTFYDTVKLVPSHGNSYVNPTPLYDNQTRRLFLFFAQYFDENKTQNYIMFSDNMGITWSRPQNITSALEECTDSRFHLSAAGHGIQLENGRLMMQYFHKFYDNNTVTERRALSYLYSDDNGKTWNHSNMYAEDLNADKSLFVQTKSCVIWNICATDNKRYEAFSIDNGNSWSRFISAPIAELFNGDCSMVTLNAKNGYNDTVLLYGLPSDNCKSNFKISISRDGGLSYDDVFDLMSAGSNVSHSDLCIIDEAEPIIGLIQCKCDHILFTRISLKTLTNGRYDDCQHN